jgi:hypothetical protein
LGGIATSPTFTPSYFEVADRSFRGGVEIVDAPLVADAPEPAALALFGIGLGAVSLLLRRPRRMP